MPPTLPNTLTNGTTADATQVMADLNAINAAVDQATVTSLPGSPYDGQEIYYVADATNGKVWHLKYRSASGSTYKWEFVGGSALYTQDLTDRTTTATSFTSLAGSTLTNPLAGDYEFDVGGSMYLTTTGFLIEVCVSDGVTNSDYVRMDPSPASSEKPFSRVMPLPGIAASTTCRLRGRVVAGGAPTMHVTESFLSMRPIRVG